MDRSTETFSQMGGEGVSWLGQMHFTNDKHIFVNLGDGTYFHSGQLAIRAAIAANANVTYKILFNDAVAMTGGQPVDGILTVPQIAHQMHAEGAKKIIIVTDEPEKYTAEIKLPEGVTVHHRAQLDDLQRQLRDTPGTSVLIYDQTCATEKRRRRKRGTYPDPARRVFINDAVCEGCGDCSVKSNCLSVEPLVTKLGTKRKINQSSCNKDFSCVTGFCPSFVTAEGAQMRKPVTKANAKPDFAAMPRPHIAPLETAYGILVTGVGGTGVVTIGGLLGMAAHLENKGVTVLDMAGLAQKGGAVVSHIQIAPTPDDIFATRVAMGAAGLIIGCDAIVSASADVLSKTRRDVTRAVINSAKTPTAQFLTNPNWAFPSTETDSELRQSVGEACEFIDANQCALTLLGDAIYANPLLLGYAWQKGWVPLAYDSLIRAIELNAVAVEKNKSAFDWGRYLAENGVASNEGTLSPVTETAIVLHLPESLDKVIAHRESLLRAYQNQAYAERYRGVVEGIRTKEKMIGGGQRLSMVVARNLAKLMAYKDEYEVARLYSEPEFLEKMRSQFEGEPGKDYRLTFHLAPPLLSKRDGRGEMIKRDFGGWVLPVFRVLARFKFLRGTSGDVFGYSDERRKERLLVEEYIGMVGEFGRSLTVENLDVAVLLANIPEEIRGYGHVKERAMGAAEVKKGLLLERYRGEVVVDGFSVVG